MPADLAPAVPAALDLAHDAGFEIGGDSRIVGVGGADRTRLAALPGATTAVRLPESRLWNTQPTCPSESRMRRQLSNSWMTSIGRPGFTKTQATL